MVFIIIFRIDPYQHREKLARAIDLKMQMLEVKLTVLNGRAVSTFSFQVLVMLLVLVLFGVFLIYVIEMVEVIFLIPSS